MGSDFANFPAGCHGPVPRETTISPENAPTHSMISSHFITSRAITKARFVRSNLSGYDPQRSRGGPVNQFPGVGQPTTIGL